MGLAHSPKIVTDGLVLCLDAANPKSYPGSGTTWTDLSGNGNSGTLTNGPTFNASNNGYLSFDGINDYIDVGNGSNLSFGNTFTAIAWFHVGSTTIYQPIVSKVNSDGSLGWEMANSAGTFRSTLRPTSTQINLNQSGSLSLSTWYMGAITFDNTTLKMYINGILNNSTISGGPVTLNSSQNLWIGARGNGNNFYNGFISNASIYNRALTASEIQQNFNALRGRYGL